MSKFNEEQYHANRNVSHKKWLSCGKKYKRKALSAAKELGYSDKAIKMIYEADTDGQIERVMIAAREGKI